MKKALFVLSLIVLFVLPLQVVAKSFEDVSEDNFAYEAIEKLKELNIIGGYENSDNPNGLPLFRPNNPVSRVEALKMILESANMNTNNDSQVNLVFEDIDLNAWYIAYIKTAQKNGIVKGNEDGTFAPNREVNKVELLKMLLLAHNIEPSVASSQNTDYADISSDAWYVPYVQYSLKYNLIFASAENTIEPSKNLTRGDVAEIIYRLLLIKNGGNVQSYLSQAEAALAESLRFIENQNYSEAKNNINVALQHLESASNEASEHPMVLSALKITHAYAKIIEAFEMKVLDNSKQASLLADEALKLAKEAQDLKDRVAPLVLELEAYVKTLKN